MRGAWRAFRAFKLGPRAWSSRKLAALGGTALALLLGACLALGPVVRSRAEKVAARHGMEIEIERVWPVLGGVRLVNVRFRAGQNQWLAGELDRVDVRLGWGLGLRSISVRGGRVSLSGSDDEVAEQLRGLTHATARVDDRARGEKAGPEILVEGVALHWKGALEPMSALDLEGIRLERGPVEEGPSRGLIGAEVIRATKGGLRATARKLQAGFVREDGKTTLSEARVGALDLEVSLGAGASTVGAAATGASSTFFTGDGYVEQATRLRDQLGRLAALGIEHLLPEAPVEVNGLTVVLTQGEQRLNIGPGSLHVHHTPQALELNFAPGQSEVRAKSDPSGLSVHATIPVTPGEIAVDIQGGPVTLASLGVHENDFGLIDVAKAKLEAKGKVTLSADARSLSFQGDGHLSSLSVVHKALAEEPVRGLELAWRASGMAELDGSLLRIDEGKVELGAIRFEAFGAIVHGSDYVRIDARANVPLADCQKMYDSLPAALIPNLTGVAMTGSFSLSSRFELDTRRPDDMQIDWILKNRCRITSAPPEIDVARFSRPFRRTVYDEHGQKVEVVAGPGTPDWVPLQAISPFLEAAVTTTEDGGFRFHEGFDRTAIKNSIRDNLRAGKFLRGASTITMQLAKNLYLERQKNLSRKLQEAILTTYLEQALTKDEILELYFNVVEFGPMIYGIGPAALHYFETSPNDLSLGQALFLTSILPAPKRTYFSPTGQVTKGWLGYLHKLMKIMRDRKKINDEELMDGVSEVITYHVARSPRVRPSGDIKRELGGDLPWIAPDGP